MVCEMYLKARDADALPPNQRHVAKQELVLIRALAHVGIIALVDETTGYQDYRSRTALNEILEQFIAAKSCENGQRPFRMNSISRCFGLGLGV